MDYNQGNLNQVVHQFVQDLLDLGLLQSKDELWAFFSEHGTPGAELQTLHQFISDYFKTKLDTVPEDTLDKEAQILMRLFPTYNKQHARFLLYYYGAEVNRVEIVMRIMLLHSNNHAITVGQQHSGDIDTVGADIVTSNINPDMNIMRQLGNYDDLNRPGPSNIACQGNVLAQTSISSASPFPLTQKQRMIHPKFAGKYSLQQLHQDQRQKRRLREIPSATIVRPSVDDSSNRSIPTSELLGLTDIVCAEAPSRQKIVLQPARLQVPVYTTNNYASTAPTVLKYTSTSLPTILSPAKVLKSSNDTSSHQDKAEYMKPNLHFSSRTEQPMNLIVQPKTEVHLHAQGANPTNNIYVQQVVYKKEATVQNKEQQPEQRDAEATADFPDHDMGDKRDVALRRRRPFEDILDERRNKYVRLDRGDNDLVILNDSDSDISGDDIYQSTMLSTATSESEDEVMMPQAAANPHGQNIPKDGPTGDEDASSTSYNVKLVSHVMEMFPDACPNYVRKLCRGKSMTDENVDEVIQMIFSIPEYPKRQTKEPSPEPELDFDTQVELLKEILPDADPTYLESQAQIYLGDNEAMKQFIANAVEHRNYPTMKEYLRRQQLNAQVKQYTTEFDVEKFLEVIPDPEMHFREAESKLLEDAVERHLCIQVLKNLYSSLLVRHIMAVFNARRNLIVAANELDLMTKNPKNIMKSKRKQVPVDLSALQNIPILQEIAYLNNRPLILNTIKAKKLTELREREDAKASNLMQTCNCCFDDEVMLKDVFMCENECSAFCRSCVQKSVEVKFGEGKLDFPCFKECTPKAVFNLKTLKAALNPKLFSKVAQKKQLDEVKAAGIEDLVMCPFCDFATIPPPGDKIFKCLNPECMKESCRECKEPSHVPLRCDEIEKDADVQKRTYIENKMTEALLRTCYNCGMKFIKEDGCNKMTCSRCLAQMCYICLKPVKGYDHFNGQGGEKFHLCPLYSDTNKMHVEQVMKGAQQAKNELGVNNEELKIDPTTDVQKHYNKRKAGGFKDNLNHYLMQMQQIAPGPHAVEHMINHQQNIRHMVVNYARIDEALPANAAANRLAPPNILDQLARHDRHHHHHHHHHHHRQNRNNPNERRNLQ